AYPGRLADALREDPPDVLMLSNYMWNEQLSLHFARKAKQLRPDTLVVLGGPNICIEDERKRAYLAQHPEIDIYALGEADFLATEIVKHFLDAGLDRDRLVQRDLPSSLYRRDGEIVLTPIWPRRRTLDDIPSP